MICRSFMLGLGILGLGTILVLEPGGSIESTSAAGKPEAPAEVAHQDGVEFLARGPIHEAFAAPAIRGPRSAAVIAKEPPKPVAELPPDQKPEGDNVQWIPGYWAWNDDTSDFLWVSGTYRTVPPARQWVPGYWNRTDDGWQRVSGLWADQDKDHIELLSMPPPEPIEEAVPAAPSEASTFQPGCWVYRNNRYLWRSGFWTPYRADWIWTPDSYIWTPGGYIFVEGYWDYSFQNRGLLFAPVNIDRRYWGRADWFYQPSYVVYDNFLLSSLFVRPSYNQYYFGDYYDQRYDRLGFVPWTNYRYGRSIGDPLLSHYQWQNRANPGWSRDLRGLYDVRRENPAARPPRTLVQQNSVIQNISNHTTNVTNVTNVKNVTALAPLTKVDQTFIKLQPITKAQRGEVQQAASQFKEFSAQRARLEAQAIKKIQPSVQPEESPTAVKVELPKTRPAPHKISDAAKVKAPPRPVMPQVQIVNPDKTRPVPETKLEPKPNPKPEAKPAPKPDLKPEPKATSKPDVKPETKPAPKPDVKPEPKADVKPETKPVPSAHKDKDKGKGKDKDKDGQ